MNGHNRRRRNLEIDLATSQERDYCHERLQAQNSMYSSTSEMPSTRRYLPSSQAIHVDSMGYNDDPSDAVPIFEAARLGSHQVLHKPKPRRLGETAPIGQTLEEGRGQHESISRQSLIRPLPFAPIRTPETALRQNQLQAPSPASSHPSERFTDPATQSKLNNPPSRTQSNAFVNTETYSRFSSPDIEDESSAENRLLEQTSLSLPYYGSHVKGHAGDSRRSEERRRDECQTETSVQRPARRVIKTTLATPQPDVTANRTGKTVHILSKSSSSPEDLKESAILSNETFTTVPQKRKEKQAHKGKKEKQMKMDSYCINDNSEPYSTSARSGQKIGQMSGTQSRSRVRFDTDIKTDVLAGRKPSIRSSLSSTSEPGRYVSHSDHEKVRHVSNSVKDHKITQSSNPSSVKSKEERLHEEIEAILKDVTEEELQRGMADILLDIPLKSPSKSIIPFAAANHPMPRLGPNGPDVRDLLKHENQDCLLGVDDGEMELGSSMDGSRSITTDPLPSVHSADSKETELASDFEGREEREEDGILSDSSISTVKNSSQPSSDKDSDEEVKQDPPPIKPSARIIQDKTIPPLIVKNGELKIVQARYLTINIWRLIESRSKACRKVSNTQKHTGAIDCIAGLKEVTRISLYDLPDVKSCKVIAYALKIFKQDALFPNVTHIYLAHKFRAKICLLEAFDWTKKELAKYAENFAKIANVHYVCLDYDISAMHNVKIAVFFRHLRCYWKDLAQMSIHQALGDLPYLFPDTPHFVQYRADANPSLFPDDPYVIRDSANPDEDELESEDEASPRIKLKEEKRGWDLISHKQNYQSWFQELHRVIRYMENCEAKDSKTTWTVSMPGKIDGEIEKAVKWGLVDLEFEQTAVNGVNGNWDSKWKVYKSTMEPIDLDRLEVKYRRKNTMACELCRWTECDEVEG